MWRPRQYSVKAPGKEEIRAGPCGAPNLGDRFWGQNEDLKVRAAQERAGFARVLIESTNSSM
jgi:hypothetical protein